MSEEKPRTLEDMEEILHRNGIEYAVITESLRQEAIKWIKYFRKGIDEDEYRLFPQNTEEISEIGIVEFIKHFFNISEEDIEEMKE